MDPLATLIGGTLLTIATAIFAALVFQGARHRGKKDDEPVAAPLNQGSPSSSSE